MDAEGRCKHYPDEWMDPFLKFKFMQRLSLSLSLSLSLDNCITFMKFIHLASLKRCTKTSNKQKMRNDDAVKEMELIVTAW